MTRETSEQFVRRCEAEYSERWLPLLDMFAKCQSEDRSTWDKTKRIARRFAVIAIVVSAVAANALVSPVNQRLSTRYCYSIF